MGNNSERIVIQNSGFAFQPYGATSQINIYQMKSDENNKQQAENEHYASYFKNILLNWNLQKEVIKNQEELIKKLTDQVAQLSKTQSPVFNFNSN